MTRRRSELPGNARRCTFQAGIHQKRLKRVVESTCLLSATNFQIVFTSSA
jgi:hypothetical protein